MFLLIDRISSVLIFVNPIASGSSLPYANTATGEPSGMLDSLGGRYAVGDVRPGLSKECQIEFGCARLDSFRGPVLQVSPHDVGSRQDEFDGSSVYTDFR